MKSQIEMGLEVEAEHRSTYDMMLKYAETFYRTKVELGVNFPTFEEFRLRITLEHLAEMPTYYTELEKMEKSHTSLKSRISKKK